MGADFAAVILAGGTAVRMDGVDKAGIEYAGRTLLEHSLGAVSDAVEVVVVGDPVPTSRAATFVREEPAYGGPAAGLLAGRDALHSRPAALAVVAVDMPLLSADTLRRLMAAAEGRQLAGVLDLAALDRVRPVDAHGMPLNRLLASLDLALLTGLPEEYRDVDTWADLRDLGADPDH
jgi:molybdopterin-guanine dinucleotide biosynthesis protein A